MTSTRTVRANGIEICYETIGDPADETLLLVMGLGSQLNSWEREFCEDFARKGYYVIRYDNRDVGLSTRFDGHTPDIQAVRAGDYSSLAYGLADMAADGVGLLDALGIERAHVLGASMGGMIAQLIAIRNPARVLSLCSIMSSTGSKRVGQPTAEARAAMIRQAPGTRQEVLDLAVERAKILTGGGFPFDEAMVRRRAARMHDRAYCPVGAVRQQMAVLSAADRTEQLGRLRLPTVVIHGDSDPLVTPSGGEATAAAIPDAKLVVIPGLGHEFPRGAWHRIVKGFHANTARVRRPR